jgi:molybdenum cofactor cytidylyltransferase
MAYISGVILAAGLSKRMGKQKLLLSFGRQPIIQTSLDNLINSKVNEIIVVLEHNSPVVEIVRTYLDNLKIERTIKIVENTHSAAGLSSSLKLGVSSSSPESDGYLFVLGDMPLIFPEIIDRVVDTFHHQPDRNIVSYFAGKRGHPVVISSRWKKRLMAVEGDSGARGLLDDLPGSFRKVSFPTDIPAIDIDTREDFESLGKLKNQLPENRFLDYISENFGSCISISGDGGKTSLMVYLAARLRSRFKKVLISTTTQLLDSEIIGYGADAVGAGMEYDTILLETDGSAGRPIKFPGDMEPVFPGFANICIHVIGLSEFSNHLSTDSGIIDASVLARIIDHPLGAFKAAPPGSRHVVVFNQCDHLSVEERLNLKVNILHHFDKIENSPKAFVFSTLKPIPRIIDFIAR